MSEVTLNALGGAADKNPGQYASLQNLASVEKVGGSDVEAFVHGAVDALFGRAAKFDGDTTDTTARDAAIRSVQEFAKLITARQLDATAIKQDLKTLSLPAPVATALYNMSQARASELRTELIRAASTISSAHLSDFDWKVQAVIASDKISEMQVGVVILSLSVIENGNKRDILVELPKEDLDKLLTSLGEAHKVVQSLKVV